MKYHPNICPFYLIQMLLGRAQLFLTDPRIKRLAITLMYCNRLQAWWSTQLRSETLLSPLIARLCVELQTL